MSPRIRDTNKDIPPINKRLCEFWGSESSDKISSKTGINAGTIRGYLNGRQTPSAEFLAATVAQGGDAQYILTGVRSTQSPAPAGHTADDLRVLQYRPAKNRALNVVRLVSEIEGYMQVAGGEQLQRWNVYMEEIQTKLEMGLPGAALAAAQAEEQAQKSQAG